MKHLIVSLVVVFVSVTQTQGTTIEWKVEDGGNGHYYELVHGAMLWPDAKVAAEQRIHLGVSGHLVTITNKAENDFVFSNVFDNIFDQGKHYAWIGLTDNEAYGGYESFGQPNRQVDGWIWVTGEPVNYTNWNQVWNSEGEYTGEPSNTRGNEDYATITWYKQLWNDWSWYHESPYIVEYGIPEPSTFVLLCMGVVGLLVLWRK